MVIDASTCAARLKTSMAALESIEFLHDAVLPRLTVTKIPGPVLLHINCAVRRMGLEAKLLAVARACAETVVVPEAIGCCGFAGDKGFTTPELNDHALRRLAAQVPAGCQGGYSSNRTCEIGLAEHAGVPFRSIVDLVVRATGDGPGRRH